MMAHWFLLTMLAATGQVTETDPAREPPPPPGAALPDRAATDAPPPVATTPVAVEGAKTYLPADFARFAPRTAFDMLSNVPGFAIRQQVEQRGLGQATGNVILNGERFSGKSNDVVTELRRISAENVVRIEIVDGATLDIPGLSGQVANVVTRASKLNGAFTYRPQIRTRRIPALLTNGEISVNGQFGNGVDYTFAFANNSRRNGNNGPEVVFRPDGTILDRRDEDLRINQETPQLSARLHKQTAGGDIWNFNGLVRRDRTFLRELSQQSGLIAPDRERELRERRRERFYEVSGDYEFGLGDGRLKLIGLRRANDVNYTQNLFFDFVGATPDTADRYIQLSQQAETIARSEYRWKGGGADWQVSLEGTINQLDVDNALFSRDLVGVFQPVPFPNASDEVEEKRAEAILSYGRPLSRTVTLQLSGGAEYSRLSQSGPGGLTRQFVRPKGTASIAWRPSPRTDWSLKVERTVGQLSFFDFVATRNISAETANAGNVNLVPPQNWNIDLQWTRNLGAWGNTSVRGYVRFISDIVDVIPIGLTGQAPGNLDSAFRYGVQWTSTVNFDPIGAKGVRLDADIIVQRSQLDDPLTGERREINEQVRSNINLNLRHDIPRTTWAYGATYEDFTQAAGFRLDQRFQVDNSPGGLSVFVENKDVFGLTARATLFGLLNTHEDFTREFYNGRRTNGLLFTEDRSRTYGLIFLANISGKF